MADELIKIEQNIPKVQKEIGKVAKKTGTPAPLLKTMGKVLTKSTDERFSKEQDPQGNKWKELKPSTRKRKKNSKILTESTKLRDGISDQLDGDDTLLVGSDSPYGAIHQLGGEIKQEGVTLHLKGTGRNTRFARPGEGDRTKTVNRTIKMPARTFLGVSRADEEELLATAGDYLMS